MNNQAWVTAILDIIEEFASLEFQERVWRHGNGPEISSYEEAMCKLFDDYGIKRLVECEWQQVGLSDQQHRALTTLSDTLDRFGQGVPLLPHPDEILDHPNWPTVRVAAQVALATFPNNS